MSLKYMICLIKNCVCNKENNKINCNGISKEEETDLEHLILKEITQANQENLYIYSQKEKCSELIRLVILILFSIFNNVNRLYS